MNWTSPTHHHYPDHPHEHALPEGHHTEPAPPTSIEEADRDSNVGGADPDAPVACTCTCGHGNPPDHGSTAQTQAEQAELVIARNQQKELHDAETKEQHRLFLGNPPRFVHYLGPTPPPWPEDDRTDEEFLADVQTYIATYDSYEDYIATDRKFNKRIQPMLYAIQMADEHTHQHPDPDTPPF